MLDNFIYLLCIITFAQSSIVNPGPVIIATKGAVWPKPVQITTDDYQYSITPISFRFKVTKNDCSLLQNAIRRYRKIINSWNNLDKRGRIQEVSNKTIYKYNPTKLENFLGHLHEVDIVLLNKCTGDELPGLDMDESYSLKVAKNVEERSEIMSETTWGILRGLETFSQLIHLAEDDYSLVINTTKILDYPRFSHRGLLLDTSRHYLPVNSILQNIRAMAYNKLNVFHWHIVDDHSFPYQSIKFPELSAKGAYHPSKIYSQADIKHIIEYARQRGIRVMPEFDTPGHTRSWGEGIKNMLSPCYKHGVSTGQFGPMDPTKDSLYTFLDDFFHEVIDVFPDKFMHLGGDEVGFACWKSNREIKSFMFKLNITGNYIALESYYIQKLLNIIDNHKANTLVWEEVFVNGVDIPNSTIVHVWKGNGYNVLSQSTKAGKPSLLSSCWYLSQLQTGGDWEEFYTCDPHNFFGTDEQKKLVFGGEACMWGEYVNEYNVASSVWPRASAVAEKLWSQKDADTISGAAKRLEEHTCRMNLRGIPAQPPNGPGFCL